MQKYSFSGRYYQYMQKVYSAEAMNVQYFSCKNRVAPTHIDIFGYFCNGNNRTALQQRKYYFFELIDRLL